MVRKRAAAIGRGDHGTPEMGKLVLGWGGYPASLGSDLGSGLAMGAGSAAGRLDIQGQCALVRRKVATAIFPLDFHSLPPRSGHRADRSAADDAEGSAGLWFGFPRCAAQCGRTPI